MIVSPNPVLAREVLELLKAEYITPREEYPHVTELIYCLTRSYDSRFNPLPPTDEEIMLWSLGFGLERVLLKRLERPETQCRDGIYYSVDYLTLLGSQAELKTTRTSTKTHDKKGLPETWLEQIMFYCYAEGKSYFDLLSLHMLGNYSPPFPQMKGRRLIPTPEELLANRDYLCQRRDWYLLHILLGVRPEPFKWCKGWECNYGPCRYKLRCDVARDEELRNNAKEDK
jgi:hypothetical protein